MSNNLKIFAGNSNPDLSGEIGENLGQPMGNAEISHFSDGEIFVQILENVRGKDVFVMQSTCSPANKNLMELLIMVDALRRASANRITAVIPYYGYARQDRKDKPRVPITSKLVADLLVAAGINRLLTMDLHADQIQGFFNIPVDHLFAAPVLVEYLKKKHLKNLVIVSPDAGGVARARGLAKRLDASLAIMDKRRLAKNEAEIMNVVGEVEGCNTMILDDMVDTAGTLVKTAESLKENGAKSIIACATHPVLSGQAFERIEHSSIDEVIVTNSIPVDTTISSKIKVLSVAKLFSEAILRIHNETSISSLFI